MFLLAVSPGNAHHLQSLQSRRKKDFVDVLRAAIYDGAVQDKDVTKVYMQHANQHACYGINGTDIYLVAE